MTDLAARRGRGRAPIGSSDARSEAQAREALARWERLGGEPVRDRPIDQPERGPVPASSPPEHRLRAVADLWVVRADLGPGVRVLVRSGELVPYGQETYPVEPVQPGELVGQPAPTVQALGAAQGDSGPPETAADEPAGRSPGEV